MRQPVLSGGVRRSVLSGPAPREIGTAALVARPILGGAEDLCTGACICCRLPSPIQEECCVACLGCFIFGFSGVAARPVFA